MIIFHLENSAMGLGNQVSLVQWCFANIQLCLICQWRVEKERNQFSSLLVDCII